MTCGVGAGVDDWLVFQEEEEEEEVPGRSNRRVLALSDETKLPRAPDSEGAAEALMAVKMVCVWCELDKTEDATDWVGVAVDIPMTCAES